MNQHPHAVQWRHCGYGRRWAFALLIALAALSAGMETACGQCQYEVTAIVEGPPGCSLGDPHGAVIPQDMNDNGDVVGYWFCLARPTDFAFRWSAESGFEFLDIPDENVLHARSVGINNHGDICGFYIAYDADNDDYYGASYVLKNDGQFISIPVPEGGTYLEVQAINDNGQACGWWSSSDPAGRATFIWEDGKLETIIPVGQTVHNTGLSINEAGQVTGYLFPELRFDQRRAFIWDSGELTILPPIPGGVTSGARAINAALEVAGDGNLGGGIEHGYAATVDSAEDLGGVEGYIKSWARDIHDNGLIVGFSSLNDEIYPATLWHNGEAHNLNLLFDEQLPFTLEFAVRINQAGTILASAGPRGVLLSPIDQPVADISGDCSVDVVDLLKLLENWSAEDSFADIDNNGIVGVSDLLILLADWDG